MQQHLLPIARNVLIFSLSHVFQTSYVVLISIDHVQQILSCAWFPAHWSSSGPDKKLQDKLANSSKEIKRMDQIFSWSQCSKLQFKFPYCQKKNFTLWLVSRIMIHDHKKECKDYTQTRITIIMSFSQERESVWDRFLGVRGEAVKVKVHGRHQQYE